MKRPLKQRRQAVAAAAGLEMILQFPVPPLHCRAAAGRTLKPGSADMAILLGAFILHGMEPGPLMLRDHMDLVYALLFGIVISQIATSGLGLIATPWLARLSVLPTRWISPFVLALVFVGTYLVRNSILDVAMAIAAGFFGYVMRRYGFPLITIVIGYILGPLAERSYLQSMQISDDSLMIFVTEPIALILMIATVGTIALPVITAWRRKRGVD